jgi:CRP-like cAMP-binding protein
MQRQIDSDSSLTTSADSRGRGAPLEGSGGNRLLSSLTRDLRADFEPHLVLSKLRLGQVLGRLGERMSSVYFPVSLVGSVVRRLSDDSAVEVGTVGNEGMIGLAAFLDTEVSDGETFVQIGGEAYCMPAKAFRGVLARSAELRQLMNRYTQAYIGQIAQSVACNARHSISRRCARWLLMTHDRLAGSRDVIPLKQEFLAMMLGVRRAGVSIAAGALQDSGLIRYRRGGVEILDLAGLERASCECYRAVRNQYDGMLPPDRAD